MKHLFAAIAASAALLAVPALAAPPYENGPVWDLAHVKTKGGHFDDYMKWLSTTWKAQQEASKKAGYIIDYKVLLTVDPRGDEPDITLATEYKNMAAMDVSIAETYAFAEKTMGPLMKQNTDMADRDTIRTLMGDTLVRELELK